MRPLGVVVLNVLPREVHLRSGGKGKAAALSVQPAVNRSQLPERRRRANAAMVAMAARQAAVGSGNTRAMKMPSEPSVKRTSMERSLFSLNDTM
jgi:hypothetical protein